MKMEVEIISTENIKPSSPTPQHLKFFKLSYLDQLIPTPFAPVILFYPINNPPSSSITTTTILDIPSRVNLLKKSLSNILPDFYPLAGEIKDDCCIDCNDEGARFIQARVNCHLKDFLAQPDLLSLDGFTRSIVTSKPVWVSSIGLEGSLFHNVIVLADTITGDGVEAWVSLDEEDMAILQRDPELLSYASLDPSPLKMGSRVLYRHPRL